MATQSSSPPSPPKSDDEAVAANVFGGVGAILGYIGAEAASVATFDRLLWPQRAYGNFSFSSLLPVALITPMGGPMHKAALKALDVIYDHGLLKGPHQGHMLGTAFFPDQGWTYTMHGGTEYESHTEDLRNCLWTRVLSYISMPSSGMPQTPTNSGSTTAPAPLRAKVSVYRLKISRAKAADKRKDLPFISEDTRTPSSRVYLGIVCSELTAILCAIAILAACRSAWALLWLAPLLIRLFSACFAIHRERLVSTVSESSINENPCNFEIHCPQSDGNFMILNGPPSLVLQFFRHYGHPQRDHIRETLQLIIIFIFISLFPIGLLCSTVWMPPDIQYVWLGWQLYVVLAMHVSRYSNVGASTSTEYGTAVAFMKRLGPARPPANQQQNRRDGSILFGHSVEGRETMRVDLTVTYHRRNQEGKDAVKDMLRADIENGFGVSSITPMSSARSSDSMLTEKMS
ncbi:hypothetical protein PG999_001302 [Apiospora kogelbergensis]|uniref:Uncharacterized protein n=2 Tax=Apiospora kogelbergensis TaxID=1337665 RepID=A0AAW0REI7_9PEZI